MTRVFHRRVFFLPIGFESHSSQKAIYSYAFSLIFVWVFFAFLLSPHSGLAEERSKRLRFGFGSCISKSDPEMFQSIVREDLDHFLILGDAIYYQNSDFKSVETMKAAFATRMKSNGLTAFLKTMPVSFIWDDHDFGPQDADSSFVFAKESEKIFRSHLPIPERPHGFTQGVHQELLLKDALFVLTDNRTFRENPDKKNPTLFGAKQLSWISDALSSKKGKIQFLVSGNQVTSSNPNYEHARQYSRDFEVLRHVLQAVEVPTVILSGDTHYAEILLWEAGGKWPILEVTSSPLSSEVAPKSKVVEENNRQGIFLGHHNYAVVTVRYLPSQVSLRAEIKDRTGKTRLSHAMVFKE